jgi:glycosyltransferase involved in cell wall biosynthesis
MTTLQLPTIAVVTPSHNHGRFMGATVRSVLDQAYPRLDYFVADGASTDDTVATLKSFGPSVRWVSEPDRGQADAINKGFARTQGEILGWLNSDDLYAPRALAAVAESFARNPDVGVVYGNADFIDAAGKFIRPCAHIEPFARDRLLHYSDFLVQPAVFFRRALFESVGGLNAGLHWAMDYDLWLRMAEKARFVHLPRVLAKYRWLGESKTGSGGRARLAEIKSVAVRHGATGLPAYFRLEAVRLNLAEGIAAARRGRVDLVAARSAEAAMNVLTSPRAMASLFSMRTWRIILTGQRLRQAARLQSGSA